MDITTGPVGTRSVASIRTAAPVRVIAGAPGTPADETRTTALETRVTVLESGAGVNLGPLEGRVDALEQRPAADLSPLESRMAQVDIDMAGLTSTVNAVYDYVFSIPSPVSYAYEVAANTTLEIPQTRRVAFLHDFTLLGPAGAPVRVRGYRMAAAVDEDASRPTTTEPTNPYFLFELILDDAHPVYVQTVTAATTYGGLWLRVDGPVAVSIAVTTP